MNESSPDSSLIDDASSLDSFLFFLIFLFKTSGSSSSPLSVSGASIFVL